MATTPMPATLPTAALVAVGRAEAAEEALARAEEALADMEDIAEETAEAAEEAALAAAEEAALAAAEEALGRGAPLAAQIFALVSWSSAGGG